MQYLIRLDRVLGRGKNVMKVIMRSSDNEPVDSTLDKTIVRVGYGADNHTVGRQQPCS